jgi:hypothetical protein
MLMRAPASQASRIYITLIDMIVSNHFHGDKEKIKGLNYFHPENRKSLEVEGNFPMLE